MTWLAPCSVRYRSANGLAPEGLGLWTAMSRWVSPLGHCSLYFCPSGLPPGRACCRAAIGDPPRDPAPPSGDGAPYTLSSEPNYRHAYADGPPYTKGPSVRTNRRPASLRRWTPPPPRDGPHAAIIPLATSCPVCLLTLMGPSGPIASFRSGKIQRLSPPANHGNAKFGRRFWVCFRPAAS
jgi:hypothetical protein